jgi:hypothetical protein
LKGLKIRDQSRLSVGGRDNSICFEITDASVDFEMGTNECRVPIVPWITIRIRSRDAQGTEAIRTERRTILIP